MTLQLRMRGWRGRHGELETADGRSAGRIELGGRRHPDRLQVEGRTFTVTAASGRRSWVVAAADEPDTHVALRRPSRWKLRYRLTLEGGRVLEVAPTSRLRRRLGVTDTATSVGIGRFERGGTFRTVWTFHLDAVPEVVRAACVWIAVAVDREDSASNVAAVN